MLAEIAALVGDPARATIVLALIDGRALTATERGVQADRLRRRGVQRLGRRASAERRSLGEHAGVALG
jgi:hypothetical protein